MGKEEGSLVNQSYWRYPEHLAPNIYIYTNNMWDNVFFKCCLETIRLCLKWRKRDYITSDKCHLHILPIGCILKVNRWNIFDTLLNPLSGQLSSKFYFCTVWSGSELCLNEDQAHESDQKSLFWRSFQSGDRFAPARPHFVTWPLRDQWHPSEGQMAGVRVRRADGDNSLVPHRNWVCILQLSWFGRS